MKIVIDIPEEQYNKIVSMYGTFPTEMKKWGLSAIKNGTPLPKGHGRLKDTDAINHELMDEYHGMISDSEMKIYKIIRMLDNAPTIIEADKE